jgi:hypothetical protein
MNKMISAMFENYSSYWVWIFLAFFLLICLSTTVLFEPLDALSALIHVGDTYNQIWLCWKHPVKKADNQTPFPTVPYRFPNGQGDAAKFLHGKENSVKWEREYGPLYRIWSGWTPEV